MLHIEGLLSRGCRCILQKIFIPKFKPTLNKLDFDVCWFFSLWFKLNFMNKRKELLIKRRHEVPKLYMVGQETHFIIEYCDQYSIKIYIKYPNSKLF